MFLAIDEKDSRPIYLQLMGQIKQQIVTGILRPGDELPSVRELADSLDINMHTVRRAYLDLRGQGILNLRLGRRARIASRPLTVKVARSDITSKMKELITEAMLTGLSPESLRHMVEEQLEQIKKD
jgi:GntR family transcriptional regulator